MMKDFGLQLKICRETAGFTQETASSLLHISVRTLGRIEKEKMIYLAYFYTVSVNVYRIKLLIKDYE